MQKRFVTFVSLTVLTILAVSLVSAFWPFDGGVTGNAVNGDSNFCTTTNKCSYGQADCDGDSQCVSGLICDLGSHAKRDFGIGSSAADACTCPSGTTWDGDSCEATIPTDTDSGSSTTTGTCIDTDGDSASSVGRVITISSGGRENIDFDSCTGSTTTQNLADGGDVTGKNAIYEYVCENGKSVRKKYTATELGSGYCIEVDVGLAGSTVNADGTITGPKTKSAKWDFITLATPPGSGGTTPPTTGTCTDSDSANSATEPGTVTFTSRSGEVVVKKDKCTSESRVKQYKCENNKIKGLPVVACADGSRCIKTDTGAKCMALPSITQIDELKTEIQILKDALCEKDSTYTFCPQAPPAAIVQE